MDRIARETAGELVLPGQLESPAATLLVPKELEPSVEDLTFRAFPEADDVVWACGAKTYGVIIRGVCMCVFIGRYPQPMGRLVYVSSCIQSNCEVS